jgi:hypothetical protein
VVVAIRLQADEAYGGKDAEDATLKRKAGVRHG